MALEKPGHIADNPVMSEKWDEITKGRDFSPMHATVVESLCFWYAVQRACMDDVTYDGNMNLFYENNMGDIKSMPQLAQAEKATNQIRQLNKQLGINDEVRREEKPRETKLYAIQANRRARSANSGRASAR